MRRPLSNTGCARALVLVLMAAAVYGGCAASRRDALKLEVVSAHNGEILFSAGVHEHDTFELSYVHSVSASAVRGVFRVRADERIAPVETVYTAFGPGLPWANHEYERRADGLIHAPQADEPSRDELRIWVSIWTDDALTVHGETVSLVPSDRETRLVVVRIVR